MKRTACIGLLACAGGGGGLHSAAPAASGYSFGWAACAIAGRRCMQPDRGFAGGRLRLGRAIRSASRPTTAPTPPVHRIRFRNGNGDWRVQMSFGNGFGSSRLIGPGPPVRAARDSPEPARRPSAGRAEPAGSGARPPATSSCTSQNSPDPSSFDNVEWLTSPYLVSDGAGGGAVHALVHNEFHGELCRTPVDQCPTGLLNDCWYASVTLACSNGSEQPGLVNALGGGYAHPASGSKLVASIPYPLRARTAPVWPPGIRRPLERDQVGLLLLRAGLRLGPLQGAARARQLPPAHR